MEALGLLAAGVAHDLNNVLGVLVGYSELLLMDLQDQSLNRDYITSIHQGGQRAAAIVQDLLTLGRRGVAVSEFIDLNAILSEIVQSPEFKKLQAGQPLVTFQIDLAPDLLTIKGSTIHLWKSVLNLIMNAFEAIDGRGEIKIRTMNRYLDRSIRGYDSIEEGDYIVLEIRDSGKGISSVDIEKIFEPFYTRKVMNRSGTGLGLAVVWGTVKDHSGYVDVKSEDGLGSVFTLYFPVTREISKEQEHLTTESWNGRGETLLVVDDVEEQRNLAMAMLNQLGYWVAAVESGEAAITFVQEREVDLLILDMIMDPGIDGLETYRRILEIRPGQRAIIVSGFSETERVSQAKALGAGAYVRKPYVLSSLGRAVRAELDRT
jgi:two-component system, cell cycle sensor histidine kinase and response regulator CckA